MSKRNLRKMVVLMACGGVAFQFGAAGCVQSLVSGLAQQFIGTLIGSVILGALNPGGSNNNTNTNTNTNGN